jgi:Xaa-Pro aminopeptidase
MLLSQSRGAGNSAALVIPNSYEKDAKQQSSAVEVQSYAPVDWWTPTDGRANYLNLLRSTLKQIGLGGSAVKLAIEERTLPVSALQLIASEFPKVQIIEAGAALAAARAIKTERELDLLRFAGPGPR